MGESISWQNVGATIWPLLLTTVIWVIASIPHYLHVKKPEFQGVYVRVLFLFPLTSAISYIGGINLVLAAWMEVLIGLIEGYIFIVFLGLFIHWAACMGDVGAALMSSRYTNRRFYLCMKSFGKTWETGADSLWSSRMQVYQFAIIKPLISFAKAVAYTALGRSLLPLTNLLIGIINVISIAVALRALLNVYLALKQSGPKSEDSEEASSNLLFGLHAFAKFTVVKTLLFFIIFNSIILTPLLSAGKIGTPSFICSPEVASTFSSSCNEQFIAFIFCVEALSLMIIAAFVFRVRDMDSLPEEHRRDAPTREMVVQSLRIWDVMTSFLNIERLESMGSSMTKITAGVSVEMNSNNQLSGV